jgi:ATP-binding cassette, subfamily C (CFTR/MRP), member 2
MVKFFVMHFIKIYYQEFQNLVNAHKDTIGVSDLNRVGSSKTNENKGSIDIHGSLNKESLKPSITSRSADQE